MPTSSTLHTASRSAGEPAFHPRAALAVLLFSSTVFACLALAVTTGAPITLLDAHAAQWLHVHAHANGGLRAALLLLTHVHSTPGILALALVAAIWLYRQGQRYWILALVAAVPGGQLLNALLKQMFARVRPQFAEPLLELATYSFPSGHALGATVLYGVLACYAARQARSRAGRVLPFVLALAMVATVSFSRMYLGVHYLSDVVAGLAEGCAWLALCLSGVAILARRRPDLAGRAGAAVPEDSPR
ncbi:phosphatase PAP2 family protein [Massilia sp. MS-15]|uniref:phosphatase PAP2 family protein n=1 Tax=Massilia sp. MS-15 TaxID=2878200 RepID=UPI001CD7472C|nr:phosphatase PAP2 family protein [Massilia sp. MS-15]MCA1246413.1 phosphatase PAP2 family protein [Massilia sp. MS-15]